MKRAWITATALALAACGPEPAPAPGAGLARCETGLSPRVCKCAFDAMPTERWQVFAVWAERHRGVSDAAVWDDASLHAALAAATDNAAQTEAAARELVFLKATCGAPTTQHAGLSSGGWPAALD